MTNYVNISELKKGDKVLFYGQTFIKTEDSRVVCSEEPNYHTQKMEPLAPENYVYWASCEIENKEALRGKIDGLLLNFDGFQGNKRVSHVVITK